MDTMTVGDLARMSGVTIRTLHHYDEIGLLSPSRRSRSGYRHYDDADAERLQAILAYRELGLGLDEIATAIDGDASVVLAEVRRRLERRIVHMTGIVESIDRTIAAHQEGTTMSSEDKLSVFGDFDPAEYAEEAEQRWGSTDAYQQSTQRTAAYTTEDWRAIQDEADRIYATFAALNAAGTQPDSPEAMEAVTAHRNHISRWFYDCTPEIHAGLGQMYVGDPRFAASIDKHGNGVAAYMSEAIAAAYTD